MTDDLQRRVADWHRRRWPTATAEHVALKAAEELGEVVAALLCDLGQSLPSRAASVPAEAADVTICLMALLGRWYPSYDLLAEVEAKLAVLTDPAGGHKSGVGTA